MAIIAASILDADWTSLRSEIESVDRAGIDMFTLDVMDGRFAPRISFGESVFAYVRKWTKRPLEAHLMIVEPERWVERFIDVGADLVVFHVEATNRPAEVIEKVRKRNRSVGLALLAGTPIRKVFDWIPHVDVITLLAVPVGFGGNDSAPDTLERIRELRAFSAKANRSLVIGVDGGVKPHNAKRYSAAGADMLAVGTGIYHASDRGAAVRDLMESTRGTKDRSARRRGAAFLSPRIKTEEEQLRHRSRISELVSELDLQAEAV
jgi:ribulose-phosphate 3-epimerase